MLMKYFIKRLKVTEAGCWEYMGKRNYKGYGIIKTDRKTGRLAHRFMYNYFYDGLTPGLLVDHVCRNRACSNPAHLEEIDNRENQLRGDTIISRQAKMNYCKRKHAYTGESCKLCEELDNEL